MGANLVAQIYRLSKFMNRFGAGSGITILRGVLASRTRLVEIKVPGWDYSVWAAPSTSDEYVFESVFVDQVYEFSLPEIDPELIIDAGANAGYTSLYFARKYRRAQIIAIEPEGANFQRLVRNTAGCPRIRALHGALWHQPGHISVEDPTAGATTVGFQVKAALPGAQGVVPAFTVSDILAMSGRERIDILKLDIEGAEKEIFEADDLAWLDKVRVLMVELHDRHKPGCSASLYRAMSRYHYEQLVCGDNLCLIKTSP